MEVSVSEVVVRGEISDDAGKKGLMVRIVGGGVFYLLGRTLCVDDIRVREDRLVRSNGLVLVVSVRMVVVE